MGGAASVPPAQFPERPLVTRDPFPWLGRPVAALLFDMDGTMADTKELHADAWDLWRVRHGITYDRAHYLAQFFGRSNLEVLAELFPDRAHDREGLRRLGMEKEVDVIDLVRQDRLPPLPGLHEFIRRVAARGLPMSIASAAPRDNVEAVVDSFGLRRAFSAIVTMDDVERTKPDPEAFLKAAAAMGVAAGDCVVLEDSFHGLEAAKAVGARSIGVSTLHPREALAPHCDLVVRDYEELLGLEEWAGL